MKVIHQRVHEIGETIEKTIADLGVNVADDIAEDLVCAFLSIEHAEYVIKKILDQRERKNERGAS